MTDIQEMSLEQLNTERENLEKEIVEMERKMENTHDEFGSNSQDDNSQEATRDYIDRALLGEQIGAKRKRMVEIEDRITELSV